MSGPRLSGSVLCQQARWHVNDVVNLREHQCLGLDRPFGDPANASASNVTGRAKGWSIVVAVLYVDRAAKSTVRASADVRSRKYIADGVRLKQKRRFSCPKRFRQKPSLK